MDVHIHTLRQIVVYEDHSDEAAILALPSRSSRSQRPLAQELASAVFVDASPIKAVIDYERYVRQAKRIVRSLQADRLHAQQLKLDRGGKLKLLQGPWAGQELDPVSLEGPLAFPMPVTIPPRKEFEPIFDFLTDDKNVKAYLDGTLQDPSVHVGKELLWHTPLVQFDRGIIYEDGRLDLCKMVLGPTHISALMDALHTNSHITQFLLGNNIISRTGAERIAAFIERFPNRVETWYLAGCHITKQPLEKLVAAMTTSTRITNVWLKRNPLGPDAGSLLAHLIIHTQHLRTLDVENTSLGDDGVAQFFNALRGQPSSLRTLYLNANGMGEKASKALAAYLDDPQTHLENLFLASNPIGDAGIVHLAPALGHHATLQRLSLASTGLASKGIALLCQALAGHPKFMTLDLQAALTTGAHGQRYNYIDGIHALARHRPYCLDYGGNGYN
ncbi:hypothetical protein W97_02053 [Coniosporium apollinis CBS 100218]|uniref:RNI-like protein n=1 Tax=Coniosporium apollinis (strain CBS 100218) TaxID=1168221 RepID=R7YLS4_CONA1|nr:uncharacterized protein W97_02053 [Coniosporium apollinis CBS 100218]EON62828.1 hypothetical protein W97_02053 [Coniosporium apollinis CBS 100218]